MDATLSFFAGALVTFLFAAVYVYRLNNQHIVDLHDVHEAGRKRGIGEGRQRHILTPNAPIEK